MPPLPARTGEGRFQSVRRHQRPPRDGNTGLPPPCRGYPIFPMRFSR